MGNRGHRPIPSLKVSPKLPKLSQIWVSSVNSKGTNGFRLPHTAPFYKQTAKDKLIRLSGRPTGGPPTVPAQKKRLDPPQTKVQSL